MTDPGVVIRTARAADVDAIHAIEVASFTDPWKRVGFRDLILAGAATVIVAADAADTPVGFGILVAAADEAEIANVAVAPDARRRGIGAALVDHLLAVAEHAGAAAIYLEVRESNVAARALYGAKGFCDVSRRRAYYRLPDEDAIVMRRPAPAIA
ncbi:MAG: ribosomal protein S18-alanine N-acetyltransferase [Gemmatimonadota bacterium]|nr:ribosomal protein S18-alanine N-acetyltransferase [Gemmatimonadota bacterium]